MSAIDIGTVLAKFDDQVNEINFAVNTYQVRFITADGRLRTLHGRKNVKSPHQQLATPLEARGKVNYNLKRAGIMLLHDLEAQAPRTVKPATFCHFLHSGTWLKIRH
jgi:hypothetical protein